MPSRLLVYQTQAANGLKGPLQKLTSMKAEFLHELFDFFYILKSRPEEDLFSASERALGPVEKPCQILVIDLDLVPYINTPHLIMFKDAAYRPHDLRKVLQDLSKDIVRDVGKPTCFRDCESRKLRH